jgi:protein-disulfide isomerase
MEQQEQTKNETQVTEIKKPTAISTPAAIICAGVIIALALIFSGKGTRAGVVKNNQAGNKQPALEEQKPPQPVSVKPTDYVRGDLSKAEVTIVEYSDSDCPYCQRFHVTMQDVMKKYGTKVAWVYRFFPLDIHPDAKNEAYAIACAGSLGGNDAFWSLLDSAIDITVSPEKSKPILTNMATALGIDAKAFESCIASKETKALIEAQSTEGQALGAQGTPYSVAIGKNGKQVVIPGALPIDQVSKIIDGLMK